MYLNHQRQKEPSHNIILTPRETERERSRSAIKKQILQYDWDYFLTLTFQYPVYDISKVSKAVERFITGMSIRAYNTRSKKRMKSFPVVETHCDDSLHVHMLIENPINNIISSRKKRHFHIRDEAIEAWMQASSLSGNPALSSKGDRWIEPIKDIESVTEYMLKSYHPRSERYTTLLWEQACFDGRQFAQC